MTHRIVDGCAGPGGWSTGAQVLGRRDALGLDVSADAVATARANGHERVIEDVSRVNPLLFVEVYGIDPEGMTFSPPCPAFSVGGLKAGRADVPLLLAAVKVIGRGMRVDGALNVVRELQKHPQSALALEPLRWALALRPEWLAWEQVPAVLPLWEACADVLREQGWHVWTGIVHSEQFGVPQVRPRAVLLAHRGQEVAGPRPFRSRFYGRTPDRLDPELMPWLTMGEACGWDSGLVGFPRLDDGRGDEHVVTIDGVRYRARDLRGTWYPAQTVTEKARSWTRFELGRSGSVRHRVSIEEASALQGFPEGYRWHGSPTSQFHQIADAVPPLLAAHLLVALGVGQIMTEEAAA
jgi:DNA (cytosine-5)-methyltransferase 1